jgi:hypothetical protein
MAVVTAQRKKQQNLIILFVVVILVTLGVLYMGRLRNKESPYGRSPVGGQEIFPGVTEEGAGISRQLKLDTSLLQDERFLNLVPYETLSRDIKTGRANPFIPY